MSLLSGLSKRQIKALDRLFFAEIAGEDIQLHPKTAEVLIREGWVVTYEKILPGRFPVRVVCHTFTPGGHLRYIQWCAEQVTADDIAEMERDS